MLFIGAYIHAGEGGVSSPWPLKGAYLKVAVVFQHPVLRSPFTLLHPGQQIQYDKDLETNN